MSKSPLALLARREARPAASARKFQLEFMERIADLRSLLGLLNYLPNSFFFMKDAQSRMVWASDSAAQRINPSDPEGIVGKNDYDFFPKHVADSFVRDDQMVLRTGQPLIGRLEAWFNETRELEWSVTTKFPVTDRAANRIGIFGFVKNSDDHQQDLAASDRRILKVIEMIESNSGQPITVEDIASTIGISTRQLLRLFRDAMGITIQDFILKVRIQAATQALLQPDATATRVSTEFGFCDQSAFTRQFRRHTGLTPAAFRRRYAATGDTGEQRPAE